MIIKLIQPMMNKRPMDTELKTRMAPSLGLLTIAKLFEKDHKIVFENENIRPINFEEVVDVVGISVTVDVLPRAIEIAKVYKKLGIPVVAGGIHITATEDTCYEAFDALSIGLAEMTWPDIIRDIERHQLKEKYVCHKAITSKDIVGPAYHLVSHKDYLYCNVISTSRGCPFRCDFCYNSCEAYKKLYVNRDISEVIKEIKALGKKHIMFIDDNFIGNPKWTRAFLKELKPLGIKWNAAVSANIGEMPELLDEMADSGCQSLFIGFESINDKALQQVHKGQNEVGRYEQLVEAIHKRGIMINGSFVFGLDGDDETTFKRTLDWIVKQRIETVTSHILTPYPGTKVYKEMLEAGRIIDFDLSHYNTAHVVYTPKNISKEALYEGYLNIYNEIYSLKNIIRRMPKAKKQVIPYLLFNLFYRKYGKFTEWICKRVTFERIGKWAEWLAYRVG